jgi:hypothetical protein
VTPRDWNAYYLSSAGKARFFGSGSAIVTRFIAPTLALRNHESINALCASHAAAAAVTTATDLMLSKITSSVLDSD